MKLSPTAIARPANPASPQALTVLTPSFESAGNPYLSCLWGAVQRQGVTVQPYEPRRPLAELKADPRRGDILHLHWIQGFCKYDPARPLASWRLLLGSLRNLRYLQSQGVSIVWTVHNSRSHDAAFPWPEELFRWALAHLCDEVLVMSEYGRQELGKKYGRWQRVHCVPHGHYIGAYPHTLSREEARSRLGLQPQQRVLLHLGHIKPYKGVDELLRCFRAIEDPEAVLVIAGACDEALGEAIAAQAAADSRVRLHLDFVADAAVQVYLAAADWVVLPYRRILNSGSALLALSFGRPVVVPQRGALPELITDGEQGLCYGPDADLTLALGRALATPRDRWQRYCEQALEQAQRYDWEPIGAQLCDIYRQAIARRRS